MIFSSSRGQKGDDGKFYVAATGINVTATCTLGNEIEKLQMFTQHVTIL